MKWNVIWAWVPQSPDQPKEIHRDEVVADTPAKAAKIAFRSALGRDIPLDSFEEDFLTEEHEERLGEYYAEVHVEYKGSYTFAVRKTKIPRSHEELLQNIYDLFYLDCDAKGDFYNLDKEVNGADFVEAVGEILEEFKAPPVETNRG